MICIPSPDSDGGGSRTFRERWRAWLSANDQAWTDDLSADYEILFLNAWQTPYKVVHRLKRARPHLRVVQRVDGAGRDYGRTDGADLRQGAVNVLADLTIFQSEYSRYSTSEKYRIIRQTGPIIYNPVDLDLYRPDGEKSPDFPPSSDQPRVLSAIWSPNPRKGAWRIPLLARAYPDVQFIFIGREKFEGIPNIRHFGLVDHNELARLMRSGDVFLNLSENDPCPNIVLEAMASGLPVLYLPSGGTGELVGEAGLALDPDLADFGAALGQIWANLADYKEQARQRAVDHFAPDVIFKQYLAAIHAAQRQPMPPLSEHGRALTNEARLWLQDKFINRRDWLPLKHHA